MEHNMYTSELEFASCDCCDCHAYGTMTLMNGTPIFFQCSVCDPKSWERLGAEAKQKWLDGEADLA